MPAEGVAAGDERKLMHRTVGAENGPASLADPLMNLRKPLAAVEGLLVLPPRMTEARVDFVQAHEIKVVGCGQEEFAAGLRDTVHLDNGRLHLGKMLDSLAGNHHVK